MLKKYLGKAKYVAGKTLKTVVLGVALFHGASFIYNSGCELADKINPPSEFVEFKKATGIVISGDRDRYINSTLLKFADVTNEEQITSKELNHIFIESRNYFEKSIYGQLSQTILTSYAAYYSSLTDNIVMVDNSPSTFRHELMHAKTSNNIHQKELLDEWSELAKDKNGNSYYYNSAEQTASRIRLLEKLVKKESHYDSLGFVSSYSMTNVYEDIAEFTTEFSEHTYNFWTKSQINPVFEKKLALAIKYDLLPKETMEYFNLTKSFNNWSEAGSDFSFQMTKYPHYQDYIQFRDSLRNNFLDSSEQFLEKYPESRFACGILNNRALAYANAHSQMGTSWSKASEKELKCALLLKYKGTEYMTALFRLDEIHQQLYHQYGYDNPYTSALKNYFNRYNSGDLSVLTEGVNDELVKMGALNKVSN